MLITAQKSGYQVAPVAVMYAIMSTTLTGLANPIIYGTFSHSYRKGYRRILKGLLKVVFGCQSEQEFEVLDGRWYFYSVYDTICKFTKFTV